MRRLVVWSIMIVLLAVSVASTETSANDDEQVACIWFSTSLGELTDELRETGQWSPGPCNESRFNPPRPGVWYSFTLSDAAEVRIDLESEDRDALLFLQDDTGRLIDSDDDTGGGGAARIERSLPAGMYHIEASTVGWSGREGGEFDLTLRIVAGCHEVVDLGVLQDTLSAEAVWTHFGCESTFRPDRSSQRYRFEVAEAARVQIDLTSDVADPYVYLLDDTDTLLESDDDGGVGYNSRIVRILGAGVYTIEATNWGDRDLKNLQEAEYQVSVGLAEAGPLIKLEAIDAPDRVVLGMPFEIHYRVGNLGDRPLSAVNGNVQVRVRWPYIDNWRTAEIGTGEDEAELWGVGASYHTSESVAAFGSQTLAELQSFDAEYTWRSGPTDVMLEVIVTNDDGDRLDRHRLTRPVMVLKGIEFAPVNVSVDGVEYAVAATADEQGTITTDVTPVFPGTTDDDSDGEEAELDPAISARAIYAAGVRTQVLGDFGSLLESLQTQAESVFFRVGRGGLPLSEVANPPAPTLEALLETLNAAHNETFANAGFDRQQLQSAEAAEAIVVLAGRAAARRIDQFVRDWTDLLEPNRTISAAEALQLHAELAFAEQIDAHLIEAAILVLDQRAAAEGWSDLDIAAVLDVFSAGIDCDVDASALDFADDALRLQSPIYGFLLDRAYCGATAASEAHDLLLTGLDLESNPAIPAPDTAEEPEATPVVGASRLLARVLEDGRVEFGVDLSDGERALPSSRWLQADAPINAWRLTSPITANGVELGRVHARRLEGGLVQATYVPTGADRASTARWIVSADAPVDAWLVSGELERGAEASGDDLVQRVADAGSAQFGDHLSLLSLIESNLQRSP